MATAEQIKMAKKVRSLLQKIISEQSGILFFDASKKVADKTGATQKVIRRQVDGMRASGELVTHTRGRCLYLYAKPEDIKDCEFIGAHGDRIEAIKRLAARREGVSINEFASFVDRAPETIRFLFGGLVERGELFRLDQAACYGGCLYFTTEAGRALIAGEAPRPKRIRRPKLAVSTKKPAQPTVVIRQSSPTGDITYSPNLKRTVAQTPRCRYAPDEGYERLFGKKFLGRMQIGTNPMTGKPW